MDSLFLGPRVPKHYFTAMGAGETDLGGGCDPWETGSYDLALLDANIGDYNIIKYTSVLPVGATKCSYDKVKHLLHHGSVLETIMAQMNGERGEHLCAGVLTLKLKNAQGIPLGGYACEYQGHATEKEATETLRQSMIGLIKRRYPNEPIEMYDVDYVIKDLTVTKKFGTVIALLGFVSFDFERVKEF